MTSKRKKTMRKKKKVATRLKAKKMKTTLLGATPRRTRHSMTLMRSKLLEMKPRSYTCCVLYVLTLAIFFVYCCYALLLRR
jgi:hypothetical protein